MAKPMKSAERPWKAPWECREFGVEAGAQSLLVGAVAAAAIAVEDFGDLLPGQQTLERAFSSRHDPPSRSPPGSPRAPKHLGRGDVHQADET